MFKTAQKARLYKRGQRTPSSINNVVLHTDQERCCFEHLVVCSVNIANRRIANSLHRKAVGAGWWV
jgi:hypothetical protein